MDIDVAAALLILCRVGRQRAKASGTRNGQICKAQGYVKGDFLRFRCGVDRLNKFRLHVFDRVEGTRVVTVSGHTNDAILRDEGQTDDYPIVLAR